VNMSNNNKTNGYHSLKVSKFDYSSTTPRATRWREWVVKLNAFGSVYPLLANQTSEVLDLLDYWWGPTWSPLFDLDNMNQEQEQKLYVDFQKAQYSLLHVVSENFGSHEKTKSRLSLTMILFSLWKNSRTSNQKHGKQSSSSCPTSQDGHQRIG
jgi:hypothetical protein